MVSYEEVFQENTGNSEWDLNYLKDTVDNLNIEFIDQSGQRLLFTFAEFLAYRVLDEGDAIRTVSDISSHGVIGKFFYLSKGTPFEEWFHGESFNAHRARGINCYTFASLNHVIEVISLDRPTLRTSGKAI